MSVATPTASQRPSILAAFQTAPTLVKVLVVTGRTMFRAGEVVTVLALLLTPAVRQHCLKRRAIRPALAVEGDDDGSA